MSKRRGRYRGRSRRRARITFPREAAQENLTGRPTWLQWAAMAGVLLFGVALIIGLSAASVSTHAEAKAAVDIHLNGRWTNHQGELADPKQSSSVDDAAVPSVDPSEEIYGDDYNDWHLTTLDGKYYVPVRRRVPGRSREVEVPGDAGKWYNSELTSEDVHHAHALQRGDGGPDWDMDGDPQDAAGVSTALPDGDPDGYNGWDLSSLDKDIKPVGIRRRVGEGEKRNRDEHLNSESGDEKQPISAMTSGNYNSTDMSARDDSSLQNGNDDLVRDEEANFGVVDAMTLENSDSHLNSILSENLKNHDKNHPVRSPVKNTDKIVVIVVGTVVAITVVHQCMAQIPLGV